MTDALREIAEVLRAYERLLLADADTGGSDDAFLSPSCREGRRMAEDLGKAAGVLEGMAGNE